MEWLLEKKASEWRTYTCTCRRSGVRRLTYARHDAMQAQSMSARYDGIAMSGAADGGFPNGASTALHREYDEWMSNVGRCSALGCARIVRLVEVTLMYVLEQNSSVMLARIRLAQLLTEVRMNCSSLGQQLSFTTRTPHVDCMHIALNRPTNRGIVHSIFPRCCTCIADPAY